MSSNIAAMPARILLRNADDYTGLTAAREMLRAAVSDNQADAGAVGESIGFVQGTRDRVSTLAEIVDELKDIADQVANGNYTAEEINSMQSVWDEKIGDINTAARDTEYMGQFDFLTEEGGSIELALTSKSGHELLVDSMDATPEGFGIENVDLATEAAEALNDLNAAAQSLSGYDAYLGTKADVLEVAATAIDIQGEVLVATQYAVESMDAAMIIVNALTIDSTAQTNLLLAQANISTDAVMRLLSDS